MIEEVVCFRGTNLGRFCLRYQAMDLDIGEGDFVVGRDDDCDLVLDDGRVSRRHASFNVIKDVLTVRDMQSRNGVMVNGEQIHAPTTLEHGDRIRIGSQELTTRDRQGAHRSDGSGTLTSCRRCAASISAQAHRCPHCGQRMKAAETIEMENPAADSAKPGKSSASINLLSSIAGKAINMGRHEEAERILTNIVETLMSQAEQGSAPDEAVLTDAMTLTLQLAEASGKNVLLDIPFQVYGAYQRLIPSETIEDLYRLVGATRYNNTRPIHSYIEKLKDKGASLGANERFLLQRLEGLERRVASG